MFWPSSARLVIAFTLSVNLLGDRAELLMLGFQVVIIDAGIALGQPAPVAGKIAAQYFDGVAVGGQVIRPVGELTGRVQLLLKFAVLLLQDIQAQLCRRVDITLVQHGDRVADLLKLVAEPFFFGDRCKQAFFSLGLYARERVER